MSEFDVDVRFRVHGTDADNAAFRLGQRLELARLVRPAGTPPEPGMIELWSIPSVDLKEAALDVPAAMVRNQTGDPLVEAIEHEGEGWISPERAAALEAETEDVSTIRPERSGEPPPSVPPDGA